MSTSPSAELSKLINGFRVTQAISVAATLGVPDLLRDGARPVSEIAGLVNAHPGALYRLLRALAAVGVLLERSDRSFELTPMGQLLRPDVSSSKNAWARLMGQPNYWAAWQDLLGTVRTGATAFNRVHGRSVWSYRAQHPSDAVVFDRAMATVTHEVAEAIVPLLKLQACQTVVDVGGGEGAFLARVLEAYPDVRGIVFDQPDVIARASAAPSIRQRCEFVGGDFFEAVPDGADLYLLKWILHDWNDERAAALLNSCRRAMPPGSKLIIIEHLIAPPNEGSESKFMDLNMMVITGGVERTRDEFARLLDGSGFELVAAREVGNLAALVVEPRHTEPS
jgi:SAM-dependent methyltransferase